MSSWGRTHHGAKRVSFNAVHPMFIYFLVIINYISFIEIKNLLSLNSQRGVEELPMM